MSPRDTADRLDLPCPCCDRRGTLAAYVYGEHVVVSCISCGHVWTERAYLHVVLWKAWHEAESACPADEELVSARRKRVLPC